MNKTEASGSAVPKTAKRVKTDRRFLVILAAFIMILSFSVSAHAIIDDVAPSSGSCGPNASYNITTVNNKQTLVISGYGPITSHLWNDENYISRLVIEAISIPEGITSICSGALDRGIEATSVTFPNSLVTIMPGAIGGSIRTVNIGTGTSDIRQGAFNAAAYLSTISVDSANSYYKSYNGALLSKDGTVFYFLPYGRGSSFTVPSSVTRVASGSVIGYFRSYSDGSGQSQTLALTLDGTVKTIDANAISGDVKLTLTQGVESVGTNAFSTLQSLYYKGTPRSFQAIQGISGSGIDMNKVTYRDTNVEGVSLNTNSATINVGNYITLTRTITPANATDQSVIWSSSNTEVATVNSSGRVTGVSAGTATITATTNDGGFTASCSVTVIVPVQGVSISATRATIREGETFQLVGQVTPSDATNKAVVWTSSDETVAMVDQNGLVSGILMGTATIQLASAENLSYYMTCEITVEEAPLASGTDGDLSWEFYRSSGTLYLNGTGEMSSAPWADYNSSIHAVEMVEGVSSICDGAFSGSQISEISIPGTVSRIGADAFADCRQLGEIHFAGDMPEIGETSFDAVTAMVYFPVGNATYTYDVMQNYGGSLIWNRPSFTVRYSGNGGTEIGTTAIACIGDSVPVTRRMPAREGFFFAGWSRNANAAAPEYVFGDGIAAETDVTLYAVWKAPDLKLPNALTTIGAEAFSGTAFTGAIIPDSVTRIEAGAFADNSKLARVYIPDTVTEIDPDAFQTGQNLVIYCEPGGVAESYAKAKNITTCTVTPVYDVTYDANGGRFSDSMAVRAEEAEAGEYTISAAAPVRNAYQFAGWTLNGDLVGETLSVTSDITLLALWTPDVP